MKRGIAILFGAAICAALGFVAGRGTGQAPPSLSQVEAPSTLADTREDPIERIRAERAARKPATEERVVYMTRTGTKYHTATCQYARKAGIACTLEEAQAKGLGPCSKCRP